MQAVQSPKISFKEISIVSAGFLFLLAVWFWDLFTVKMGFLSGDHRVQHYPWMHYLYTELHAGRFPLWTSLIGCGFPIFAEGQIAALYPLNLLVYGLLPISFDAAYNYSTLLHYLIGGILFYVYARTLGISKLGSFLGGFIYLFGSCQGGYFYNMNSQKTVVWFPLVLLMIEKFLRSRRMVWPLWIGFIFGIQVMAGYFQIAVYTVLFSVFYYLVRILYEFKTERRTWARFNLGFLTPLLMGLTALVTALPQLLATWELAQFSSRQNLPESFAYVGSLPPQGFLTLLFPFLDSFLGQEMYVGIFGLFLAIIAFCHWRAWSNSLKTLFWLLVLTILIALGGFSPLYVLLVKLTHFYGFRVPAKTVFFLGFVLAVLAGYGWDRTLGSGDNRFARGARIFLAVALTALGFSLLGEFLIRPLIPFLKNIGSWILEKYYVGSPLHPHSSEVYLGKLDGLLAGVISQSSVVHNFWMRWWAILLGAAAVLGSALLFLPVKSRRFFLVAGLVLLAVDLYGYNYVNIIKAGWLPYAKAFERAQPFAEFLKSERGRGRLFEHYTDLSEDDVYPMLYNQNMYYGISSVGIYSPFALEKHRRFFEGLGASNNSLLVSLAVPEQFDSLKEKLDLAHVRFVLAKDMKNGRLKSLFRSGDYGLYENPSSLPRAFWMQTVELDQVDAIKRRSLVPADFEKDEAAYLRLRINAPRSGQLFLSDLNYPGWRAQVNGRPVEIQRAMQLFRSVPLERGEQQVEFVYRPFYQKLLGLPLFVAASLALVSLLGVPYGLFLAWSAAVFVIYLKNMWASKIGSALGGF